MAGHLARRLKAVEELSHQLTGKPFLQATAARRLEVVTRMARAESNPDSGRTVLRRAQAADRAGVLHLEDRDPSGPGIQGNVVQPGDYAGFDPR